MRDHLADLLAHLAMVDRSQNEAAPARVL